MKSVWDWLYQRDKEVYVLTWAIAILISAVAWVLSSLVVFMIAIIVFAILGVIQVTALWLHFIRSTNER